MKEAELHEAEDKVRKESAEVRNEGDALVFRAQKSLTEFKDKLPSELVSDIQSRIDALKKILEGEDVEAIKAKTQELQEHIQRIGEELAKSGANTQADPAAAAQKGPTVEEAEVEIIDDEKK